MEARGKINAYVCKSCKNTTHTINLNTGTTPFGIVCPLCKHSECYSNFCRLIYNRINVNWAWIRPQVAEFKTILAVTQIHVLQGGLILRKLKEAVPLAEDKIPEDISLDDFRVFIYAAYLPPNELWEKATRQCF